MSLTDNVGPANYLLNGQKPQKKTQQFYNFDKVLKTEFGEVWGTQTHSIRRKLILDKHKEVAQLLIPDKPYTIIIAILVVFSSLGTTYLVKDSSWLIFLTTCYCIGTTFNHTCHVLIHDFTHNAGHKSSFVNKAMAIFCNIPMVVPSAIAFGKYHSEHHAFLGEYKKDPDLPFLIEAKNINSKPKKLLFVFALSLVYSLRPLFFIRRPVMKQQIINLLVIVVSVFIIIKYWGINAFAYLFISTYFSIGPHPAAMHVLAQHYQFAKGLQTYDYFGFWNFFNLNLGYHIEHHDFPNCPWYNLPKIRAAAPEFYEHLPYHTSYIKLCYKFIFDDNYNLFNRTLRKINPKQS